MKRSEGNMLGKYKVDENSIRGISWPVRISENKFIFFAILSLLLLTTLVFAEIPIYCPKCKTLLYNYQKDYIPRNVKVEKVYAKDFIPVNETIKQPTEEEPMVCPLCKCPLNGWEYWAILDKVKANTFVYPAFSLLTKDKEGKFIYIPYGIPDFNGIVSKKNEK